MPAVLLLVAGPVPWRLLPWLQRYGGPAHVLVVGWLLAAPLVLLAAALLRSRARWGPWAWVAGCALHLLVLTVTAARFPHVVPGWAWPLLGLVALCGLASVVTAFPADPRGSAPAGRRAPGSR